MSYSAILQQKLNPYPPDFRRPIGMYAYVWVMNMTLFTTILTMAITQFLFLFFFNRLSRIKYIEHVVSDYLSVAKISRKTYIFKAQSLGFIARSAPTTVNFNSVQDDAVT